MYYGFDVGGTKIEFGAFDKQLNRVATERHPTPTQDYSALIETLVMLVEKYDAELGQKGTIGIGIPGSQAEDGTVLTVNVPAANGKSLGEDLQARVEREVRVSNDANCFALSEAWDEQAQSAKTLLGLILGTGFGGGLVINGKVINGKNQMAGEVGHMRMPIDAWLRLGDNPPMFDCGCGNKGCLDNYLSGRGFEQLYAHFYQPLSAIEIIENYRQGDPDAVAFVECFFDVLAMALGGILTAFDPDMVVLGGGLSNFDELYQAIPERLPTHLLSAANAPDIVKAQHGDAGGVRGAAFLHLT
ncbi:N-acetylglucosamine kinase [Salinivibrio sharmensis]|uniref:N-acetylglucosamine kinase n=1 Tax=Salinivibrio sharmensis TaxID=390883 RepID=A0ABX3KGL6_9GAMM|nr:N-acetylglucosamine kinase [Salinivibrio sharmensis]OOE88150.1 N-acetylglucosamine kinase [Salinivibrio sharmensis]